MRLHIKEHLGISIPVGQDSDSRSGVNSPFRAPVYLTLSPCPSSPRVTTPRSPGLHCVVFLRLDGHQNVDDCRLDVYFNRYPAAIFNVRIPLRMLGWPNTY